MKLYCKNALLYIILLYIAIFRNVSPTVKENLLDSFIMCTSIVAMLTKLRDAVGTDIRI
jgi:hypothetical protein